MDAIKLTDLAGETTRDSNVQSFATRKGFAYKGVSLLAGYDARSGMFRFCIESSLADRQRAALGIDWTGANDIGGVD